MRVEGEDRAVDDEERHAVHPKTAAPARQLP